MDEIDVRQADAVAGGLLDLFLFTLVGPQERPPARGDWFVEGR